MHGSIWSILVRMISVKHYTASNFKSSLPDVTLYLYVNFFDDFISHSYFSVGNSVDLWIWGFFTPCSFYLDLFLRSYNVHPIQFACMGCVEIWVRPLSNIVKADPFSTWGCCISSTRGRWSCPWRCWAWTGCVGSTASPVQIWCLRPSMRIHDSGVTDLCQ